MRSPASMGPRLYFPIHSGGINWHRTSQFFPRHRPSRYILCSRPLPLRTLDRGSICHHGGLCTLIPPIYRIHPPWHLSKNPVRNYVYRSKPHLLPSALPRTRRNASPILRLPRRIHPVKYYLLPGFYNLPRSSNYSSVYYLRSIYGQT